MGVLHARRARLTTVRTTWACNTADHAGLTAAGHRPVGASSAKVGLLVRHGRGADTGRSRTLSRLLRVWRKRRLTLKRTTLGVVAVGLHRDGSAGGRCLTRRWAVRRSCGGTTCRRRAEQLVHVKVASTRRAWGSKAIDLFGRLACSWVGRSHLFIGSRNGSKGLDASVEVGASRRLSGWRR